PIYGPNTPVDIWRDKSGNGFDFYPSVSGNYKQVIWHNGPKGTFTNPPNTPCVEFRPYQGENAFSKHLICEDFELTGNGYTIYFVVKTADNDFGLFNYYTSARDREMLIYNDNGI